MLRINLPPTGPTRVTTDYFRKYRLPLPSKGIKARGEKNTELLFDNEDEAVIYADQLEEIVSGVSRGSQLRSMLRDMVTAIRNDDSIRNYLEYSSVYTWVKNRVRNIRMAIKPSASFLKN
jgi:hypothetical protein